VIKRVEALNEAGERRYKRKRKALDKAEDLTIEGIESLDTTGKGQNKKKRKATCNPDGSEQRKTKNRRTEADASTPHHFEDAMIVDIAPELYVIISVTGMVNP